MVGSPELAGQTGEGGCDRSGGRVCRFNEVTGTESTNSPVLNLT